MQKKLENIRPHTLGELGICSSLSALAAQIAKIRILYHQKPISYKYRTLDWALSDCALGCF